MEEIKFGPAGNSKIFYNDGNTTSLQAPKWLKQHGLNAYEYSFGRGFTMKEDKAKELGVEAYNNGVLISVHAPYYINFANIDDVMVEKSYNYVLRSIDYLKLMNGTDVVFHPASCGKMDRLSAVTLTNARIKNLVEMVYKKGHNDIFICPETMGKFNQIGTYKEIIDLCTIDKILKPTFDFGHINCVMQGALKNKDDFKKIFDYAFDKLDYERVKNCHIHFSKIEYTLAGGEQKHLDFNDDIFGPPFEPLAELLFDLKLTPTLICESKEKMMEDAIKMKQIYSSFKN